MRFNPAHERTPIEINGANGAKYQEKRGKHYEKAFLD